MDYAWNAQNFAKMKTGFEQPCRGGAPLPASLFVTHLLQEHSLGQPSWQGACGAGSLSSEAVALHLQNPQPILDACQERELLLPQGLEEFQDRRTRFRQ